MGEPTFPAQEGPTPTTPTAKPSTDSTTKRASTSPLTPDELPFTDLDSYSTSTSPLRESPRYVRLERHQHQSHNPPQFHPHSYRAARQIERLSRSLDRQNLRQADSIRPQRPNPESECPQRLPTNEVLAGHRTAPGITTNDMNQKSPGGSSVCFPGSFTPTPRGEARYRLFSSHQTIPQPARLENIGYIEPDDEEVLEQHAAIDPSSHQRGLFMDRMPFDPIEIGEEGMDLDEGFFDDPESAQLDGQDNANPSSPSALVRQGLLRFRRSAQAAANCAVVVHSVPRMRKRRKRERRREAATATSTGAPARAHSTNVGIEASC